MLNPLLENHSSDEICFTLFKSVFPQTYLAKETSFRRALITILWVYETPICILGTLSPGLLATDAEELVTRAYPISTRDNVDL